MIPIVQRKFEINPIYLEKFFPAKQRYAVLMGGAGSGKSVAAAQKILLRMKTEPGHRFLIVRKVASTLRDSVYRLFNDLIEMYDLHQEFTVLKSEFRIIHKSGNEIMFTGMDDSEKLKSIAGITGLWAEEATELEEMDLAQLDLRLRGETSNYKQIIITFNPISEDHWLKKRFFDEEDSDTFKLITTFHDNMFIDEEYKRILSERYKTNENLYRVYCLGQWGRVNTGDCFYKNFSYVDHVKEVKYNPDLPICLSMDFNTQPFCACLIVQVEGTRFKVIDEICLKSPKNTISDTCKEFVRKYYGHSSGLNIFGDASGKNDDSKFEKGYNCFSLITSELKKYRPALRVPVKNPPVMMRGLFINNVFANPKNISIEISDKCKHLINDFTYGKEGEDGGKAKTMTKDKETGASYQKYHHASDAFDYCFMQHYANQFENYKRGDRPFRITFGKSYPSKNGY